MFSDILSTGRPVAVALFWLERVDFTFLCHKDGSLVPFWLVDSSCPVVRCCV